ncbi:MAG: hypothetical protein A3J63_03140 [Candidatus Moranbacteria bacterium RIFCSPHIGHO2_02_FULL_40_12b]|nr:MAG: hypothetical protein A3J63_03140 [Candidatus Moranbacteria bacterium RIFCSPHIGHO2_02_FULL_40_12b]OGI23208.1 MAG: hypothetical protein A3E91_01980 [Candidatus Moranbacteria bacterium RIFCSPHIGHO2_12_FULL_40_10]
MSEQILKNLKNRIDEELSGYASVDPNVKKNKVKEILQYYVLNFIYNHPEYSKWIMYGGSALRIIHGLDRMSVDLDFEVSHEVEEKFLKELKNEVEDYFVNTYGAGADFLVVKITNRRGLKLIFNVGKELNLGHSSSQVHVKIDLNHFAAPKTITERRPINRDQLSFVILTYNMGALMASKLAAIFLRGTRGVGDALYEEKGRDIYDLLWYMGKKVVPDFDYLTAKDIDIKDPRTLFDKITIKILNNPKTDENLKNDLSPLFVDQTFIANWLKNWRKSYLRLLDEYKIRTIIEFEGVEIYQDLRSDNFYFHYSYKTEETVSILITYMISDYWIEDVDLSIEADKKLEDKIKFSSNGLTSKPASQEKLKKYAKLFHQKTEDYFKKNNNIMLGDRIITKLIRMTADNLNLKEQILINKSTLLRCELDDLLK